MLSLHNILLESIVTEQCLTLCEQLDRLNGNLVNILAQIGVVFRFCNFGQHPTN